MIIISDTSAITNLFTIGRLELLQELYREVYIPPAVFEELIVLEEQAAYMKENFWIVVANPEDRNKVAELMEILDKGESEAIVLALELSADYLIMDEKLGRALAKDFGIPIIGLLGVLMKAKSEGVTSEIKPILEALIEKANFHINPKLLKEVLEQAGEG